MSHSRSYTFGFDIFRAFYLFKCIPKMTNEQAHRSTFFPFSLFFLYFLSWCDTLQSWHWLLSHVRVANGVVRLSQCKPHLSPRLSLRARRGNGNVMQMCLSCCKITWRETRGRLLRVRAPERQSAGLSNGKTV